MLITHFWQTDSNSRTHVKKKLYAVGGRDRRIVQLEIYLVWSKLGNGITRDTLPLQGGRQEPTPKNHLLTPTHMLYHLLAHTYVLSACLYTHISTLFFKFQAQKLRKYFENVYKHMCKSLN